MIRALNKSVRSVPFALVRVRAVDFYGNVNHPSITLVTFSESVNVATPNLNDEAAFASMHFLSGWYTDLLVFKAASGAPFAAAINQVWLAGEGGWGTPDSVRVALAQPSGIQSVSGHLFAVAPETFAL